MGADYSTVNTLEPSHTVTADVVLLVRTGDGPNDLKVLLVARGRDPIAWALPGGKVATHESPLTAAVRELREETGAEILPSYLRLLDVAGDPGRDHRGHTVSAVYFTMVDELPRGIVLSDNSEYTTDALFPPDPFDGREISNVHLFPVKELAPHLDKLAFDHGRLIREALTRVGAIAHIQQDP